MNYDFQFVIYVPTGSTIASGKVVEDAASNLHKKEVANSALARWTVGGNKSIATTLGDAQTTTQAIAKLTANSRIYLVAHGDLGGTTLAGGVTGAAIAEGLHRGGIRVAKRIALAVCLAGQLKSDDPFASIMVGTPFEYSSTAKSLHKRLGELGVYTEVAARTDLVGVNDAGNKFTRTFAPAGASPFIHKAPKTKVVYSWDAGRANVVTSYPYGE